MEYETHGACSTVQPIVSFPHLSDTLTRLCYHKCLISDQANSISLVPKTIEDTMQGKRKYIYMYFWGLVNIHESVGERKNNEKNARRTVVFGKRRRGEKKKKKRWGRK